jgi:DnaJ-class molecular chaperone
MNCKKCLQHGFFIKKNCEICKGTGYLKEKHKIRVTLEHQQDVSFYIYPEESDEKKGYDLPGDIYVKVVAD